MTDLEKLKALIAIAEQTYIENYYGDNIVLFDRSKTHPGTNSGGQSVSTSEEQSL